MLLQYIAYNICYEQIMCKICMYISTIKDLYAYFKNAYKNCMHISTMYAYLNKVCIFQQCVHISTMCAYFNNVRIFQHILTMYTYISIFQQCMHISTMYAYFNIFQQCTRIATMKISVVMLFRPKTLRAFIINFSQIYRT